MKNYKKNATKYHRSFNRTRVASAVSASFILSSLVGPLQAQELEEIIVTATKRSESVQDVALAITALSGDFVQQANLNDVKDLVTFTPGVSGNSQDSFIDAISVRGIRTQDFGIGGDPSSAFFKNDLYEGRNGSAVTSLYDVERAEVLRGPVGFLFGRSAIGGAFNVHTKQASIGSNDASINIDLGERGHVVGEGAINFPVNDNFAVRLAGYSSTEDGFVENFNGGEDLISHDKQAIRLSTTTETENLSIFTTLEFETREQSGSVYRAVTNNDIFDTLEAAIGNVPISNNPGEINSDLVAGNTDDSDVFSVGIKVNYDLGFATLTSNTGYKDHDFFYEEDYDGTPLQINNYRQDQEGDYFQQELRLTSETEGPFSWYAGVSYYKENIDTTFTFTGSEDLLCSYYGAYYNPGSTFSGCAEYYGPSFTPSADGLLVEPGRIIGDYSGYGAYVNLDYLVSETVEVSLGLRYTEDTKVFNVNVPTPESDLGAFFGFGFTTTDFIRGEESFDDITPRVLVKWTPTDDALVFASFTEGFKSGGFGTFGLTAPDGNSAVGNTDIAPGTGFTPSLFNSEFIDSYELGYKDTWFRGSTRVAFTAFFYDYTDLQVIVPDDQGIGSVGNAGQFDGAGLEASITTSLSDNYSLYIAASYLDSEGSDLQEVCGLEDVNGCEGSSLFWAPEFTAAFVLNASYPTANGEVTASLEGSFESERGGGFEGFQSTLIDSYAEFGFRIGYKSDNNWRIGAYVENLTDEFTYDGQNNNGGILPSQFFGPKRPRTVGVTFNYLWE